MRSKAKRILAVLSVTAAAAAIPLVTAAPAQAGTPSCLRYLKAEGYVIGPKVQRACELGAEGPPWNANCLPILWSLEVKNNDADTACALAAK